VPGGRLFPFFFLPFSSSFFFFSFSPILMCSQLPSFPPVPLIILMRLSSSLSQICPAPPLPLFLFSLYGGFPLKPVSEDFFFFCILFLSFFFFPFSFRPTLFPSFEAFQGSSPYSFFQSLFFSPPSGLQDVRGFSLFSQRLFPLFFSL